MRRSLRSWLWRVGVDQEVDEELAFHLEMRTRELIAGGMPPDDARRAAQARLGDLAHLRRTCVELGGVVPKSQSPLEALHPERRLFLRSPRLRA